MEDLYKNDPNSWMRTARFSKTVYHRPDPSQMPVVPLAELKLWYSDLNSNWDAASIPITLDNTSKASQSPGPTLNWNTDNSVTSKVPEGSDYETNKTIPASKNKALSDMLKAVKDRVWRKFVAPSPRDRMEAKTVRSSSKQKKNFDREVRQVSAPEKSSEVRW